jgi:transposase-like protein
VNGYGYYCDACGDEDSALVLEVTKQGEDYYFCDGCHKRYKEELIAPCVNCTYVDEIYQMYNVNTIGQPEYICDGCLDEFQQPTINHGRLAIDHLDCGTNCQ